MNQSKYNPQNRQALHETLPLVLFAVLLMIAVAAFVMSGIINDKLHS